MRPLEELKRGEERCPDFAGKGFLSLVLDLARPQLLSHA